MSSITETSEKPVRKLIKLGIRNNHRSLFVILGPNGSNKVPIFYHLLKQYKVKDISTLWCTKENVDVLQKRNEANFMETFDMSDNDFTPCYCSYSNIDDISHCTFNILVLQDFEAVTLHNLSSILYTAKGGGIIVFLLHDLKNLDDLVNLKLNAELKLSRFSKRFASSLRSCPNSVILDEKLCILHSGPKPSEIQEVDRSMHKEKIEELKAKFENDTVISTLLGVCQTQEQAELLSKFLEIIKNRTFHSVLSVSSAVGRGKSAALGLAIAGSLAFNYSNIFISSISHKNVNIIFKFLLKGLDVLNYKEDEDFDLIQSVNPKLEKALTGINIFRDHPQSIRFIFPEDSAQRLEQAELVVFDEAASIPTQMLKGLFGPYVVLIASSTSGPGSSSPYLYSNLINSIRPSTSLSSKGERFQQFVLNEPVHYASGDGVESWLNRLLCVEPVISSHLSCGFPVPEQCRLFSVNRDTLFGGSKQSEDFLQSLMSVLTSSSRVMNPDHLVNLADSPNYQIFCLLPPVTNIKQVFSGVICIILVHIEHEIPECIVHCGTNLNGPFSNCCNDWKSIMGTSAPRFLPMKGIHVLNIVTHQNYRKMGYGLRALQLLQEFYEGKCISLDEDVVVQSELPESSSSESNALKFPILQQLTELQPDKVEYILVSFNLTSETLRFWKKSKFTPAYLSEQANSEGEHTLFMLKAVDENFKQRIEKYWFDFQNHFCIHLGSEFRNFKASLTLSLMQFKANFIKKDFKELTKADIDLIIRPHHMKLLEKYCQNLQDFYTVIQLIPTLALLFFKNRLKDVILPRAQEAILLSFGLQYKTADDVSKDLGLPNMQIHGLLNRTIKKIANNLSEIIEKSVESTFANPEVVMEPITQDLDEELEEAAKKIQEQQAQDVLKLKDLDVSQYAIKGSEEDWEKALFSGRKALVSIKGVKKISTNTAGNSKSEESFKRPKHQKKRKR